MLPARRDDQVVEVHRTLDVAEEDLIDAITAFAAKEDLELDRRHEGEGLLFRRAKETASTGHLFKRGDLLQVVFTDTAAGHEVEFVADLRGSLERKAEARRGQVVRSLGLAGLFAYLGVRGLIDVVSIGDFVLLGLSAMFGRRAARHARGRDKDLDEVQLKIANALNAVCDDALYGADPD